MRGIVLIPLKILVLVAGLEPARSLERGILSPIVNAKTQYIVVLSYLQPTIYCVFFSVTQNYPNLKCIILSVFGLIFIKTFLLIVFGF